MKTKEETIIEIKDFSKLKDNWDGFGSPPIIEENIDNSITFLRQDWVPVPTFAYPEGHGSVTICWNVGLVAIEKTFGDDDGCLVVYDTSIFEFDSFDLKFSDIIYEFPKEEQ